jgi:ankyrin repeat protein
MRVLLDAGAKPGATTLDHTTTLQVASGMARVDTESIVPEARHLEAVKMLVALGANVNDANDLGNTALHAAAMAGFDSVAQFLVDRGAALNAKNKNGETPLRLADGYIADTMLYVRSNTAALLRKLGATE